MALAIVALKARSKTWSSFWTGRGQRRRCHRARGRSCRDRVSANRATSDHTSYDIYPRALAHFPWLGKGQLLKARNLFDRATPRDPRYGPALAGAGVCHLRLCLDGWTEVPEASRRKAPLLRNRHLRSPTMTPVFSPTLRSSSDVSTAIVLRSDPVLADREPLLGHSAVDLTLDREDLVDPADRFDSERRFAKIGQYEEFAPTVAPAGRLGDGAGSAPGIVAPSPDHNICYS